MIVIKTITQKTLERNRLNRPRVELNSANTPPSLIEISIESSKKKTVARDKTSTANKETSTSPHRRTDRRKGVAECTLPPTRPQTLLTAKTSIASDPPFRQRKQIFKRNEVDNGRFTEERIRNSGISHRRSRKQKEAEKRTKGRYSERGEHQEASPEESVKKRGRPSSSPNSSERHIKGRKVSRSGESRNLAKTPTPSLSYLWVPYVRGIHLEPQAKTQKKDITNDGRNILRGSGQRMPRKNTREGYAGGRICSCEVFLEGSSEN